MSKPVRLLNTRTLELETPGLGTTWPPYYTLSHRWDAEGDEPTLQQWTAGTRSSRGAMKITQLCSFIEKLEHASYVWVDSICIDKQSSAELSEAINGMASYYAQADACIVYLADVHEGLGDQFRTSEWFTRGWTLQELLFSHELHFCNSSWTEILRMGPALNVPENARSIISQITCITERCFGDADQILNQSIACRMSWAARRKTTRTEDIAYCLMGIFDVNMPLLYGEGDHAFLRLQRQIMEQTDDETIFAWMHPVAEDWRIPQPWPDLYGGTYMPSPFLAPHPRYFSQSAKITPYRTTTRRPHRVTNKGIEIEAQAVEIWLDDRKLLVIQLNCIGTFATSPIEASLVAKNSYYRLPESCFLVLEEESPGTRLVQRYLTYGLSWAFTGASGTVVRLLDSATYYAWTGRERTVEVDRNTGIVHSLISRYTDAMDIRKNNERGKALLLARLQAGQRQRELREEAATHGLWFD